MAGGAAVNRVVGGHAGGGRVIIGTGDYGASRRSNSQRALPDLSSPGASLAALAAVPAADWAAYLADDSVRLSLLDAVARYGAGLLRGVPADEGMVTAVAETFGYVRETNYGRIFDVRVVADPANLAFTSRAIAPHTDNPYRDPVPTLQLLHCLRDASAGGDTVLVDGFAAAAALRAADPASFAVLTSTPIPFAYVDKATLLTACQPLIALNPARPHRLRPAEQPVDASRCGCPSARPRRSTRPTGRGRRSSPAPSSRSACGWPPATAWSSTTPASCTPAPPSPPPRPCLPARGLGERHLQGCYADLDGLLSTRAVLRRTQTPIPASDNSKKCSVVADYLGNFFPDGRNSTLIWVQTGSMISGPEPQIKDNSKKCVTRRSCAQVVTREAQCTAARSPGNVGAQAVRRAAASGDSVGCPPGAGLPVEAGPGRRG